MSAVNRRLVMLLVAMCLCSCGKDQPFRKETFPVTGQLIVDGQPAENVVVTCHDLKGLDKVSPTFPETNTGKEGVFKISTYQAGDGVPEGEYALTFYWGELNLMSMSYGGPDKLNDRYRDPATSTIKVVVKKGKPADLGRIELTTK